MALEQLTAMIVAPALHLELGICEKFLDSSVSKLGWWWPSAPISMVVNFVFQPFLSASDSILAGTPASLLSVPVLKPRPPWCYRRLSAPTGAAPCLE